LEDFLAYPIRLIPYVAITLMFAFTFHEYAHAYVAYKFGDDTAKKQGRLTLNPIQHMDPLGTLLIFIVGFGWARPVPVNRYFFKRPRLAGILVSIAGPISNLILACLGFLVLYAFLPFGITENANLYDFLKIFIGLNLMLFVFNLLPLPPLDGYRIVEDLMPNHIRAKMTQYEMYGSLIFLVLVLTPLDQYTIGPIFQTVIPFVSGVLDQFFANIFIS
jgi:Zn-dependent protease